jgi:FxLD family lantipeptide
MAAITRAAEHPLAIGPARRHARLGRSSQPGIPMERNHVMHTANPAGTYDDPFDLGAVLIIDTAAANAPRRCDTDDGCTPTCASSCTSGS